LISTPEEWRLSTALPEYEVSSLGRVRRIEHFGLLPNGGFRKYGGKAWLGVWEPVQNRFTIVYRGKTYRVARLVCEAFNGPSPFKEAETLHIDEDSRNNQSSNLKWGTREQNLNCDLFIDYAVRACRLKMAGAEVKALVPRRA